MKRHILLLMLIACFLSGFAGGLSAWQEDTPYGHKIDHDGSASGWVCLSLDTHSVCFQQFYFYKGHTIAHSDSLFYIINERTETVQKFTNEKQWLQTIKKQKLEPFVKRQYDANYSSAFGDGTFFFIIFFPLPLLFPLTWLFCLISLLFEWRWAKGFRKHYTWVYPSIILLVIMYSVIPQSF